MMEQMLSEIRSDVKQILQTQARMEEQHNNLKADMQSLESEFKPIKNFHNGAKWAIGAILTAVPIITIILRIYN